MTTAAIYLRISQDPKRDGLAVERQRGECERIASERGWTVVERYADTVSASKRLVKRPAYDRMQQDFQAGRFDVLICYDLDRLTRQPRQLEDWIDLAVEHNLIVVTANGEADLGTDGGRMYARVKAAVARSEIERKGVRQRAKNVQNVERGIPVPGRRRFGFESDGVTLRESEAERVRWMYDQVLSGVSLRSIVRQMQEQCVDPAPGKEWTTRRVRDTLMMPAYFGAVRYDGAVHPGDGLPQVVSPETAAAVTAILKDEKRRTTPGPTVKHLYSGIAICGTCGHTLIFMRSYRCPAASSHPSITKDRLESHVLDWLVGNLSLLMRERSANRDGSDVVAMRAQRADLLTRRSRAQQLAEDPDFDLAEARSRVRALAREIEDLDQRIDAADVATAKLGILEVFASRRELMLSYWNGDMTKTNKHGLPVMDIDGYQAAQTALADELRQLWADPSAKALDDKRRFLRATVRIVVNSAKSDLPRIAITPLFAINKEQEPTE